MFTLNSKLINEHGNIENHNADLKEFIEFLENSNETLKYQITNIRNHVETNDTCVSMKKKEVKDLHEIISKFTKGKNLDLILSNQRHPLNKTRLQFKSNISHTKGFYRKKSNCPTYKCSYCEIFDNLYLFCFHKLRRSVGSNHRPLRTTNALGPKKIWVPKMKT